MRSTRQERVLPDCPSCGGELGLSQPDERCPRYLLGVCRGCGRWFLLTFSFSFWADRETMPAVTPIELDPSPIEGVEDVLLN